MTLDCNLKQVIVKKRTRLVFVKNPYMYISSTTKSAIELKYFFRTRFPRIMSILVNPQKYSYERSVFEHPSKLYDSYQENGTKYLKNRKPLEEELKQQLNACAGEIFLSGIPPETKAEQIAEIAALLGEVYILRFKVNFSGNSRSFAYLQYMNPNIMQLAIMKLPSLFCQYSFPMIRVRKSRNSSKLLLKKTYRMTPQDVFENLKKLINFHKLVGREIFHGYFEYQIIFKCNEEAVHARRELLRSITSFGRNAILVWDTTTDNEMTDLTSNTQFNNNGIVNYSASAIGPPNPPPDTTMMSTTQSMTFTSHENYCAVNRTVPLNYDLF